MNKFSVKYCNYIITIPIITKECEHGFCFECIKNDFINKPISSTVCAACGINVTPEKISNSRLLSDLIKTFKEPCSKGCGAEVELQYMDDHKIKCTGASPSSTMNHVTLTNILELSPEDNISKNIHEAVGHGLRLIMAKSEDENTVEIRTGGQVYAPHILTVPLIPFYHSTTVSLFTTT